jgi:hypothetical protein
MRRHLAFKCTYNDGGEGDLVGFHGICSLDNMEWNIKSGRDRCNHPECPCKQHYDRGFTGSRPTPSFCYESSLFRDWRFGAGFSQHGSKKTQLRRIADAEVGRIAVLTTRFPEDDEVDRKIIGLFRIGEVRSDEETIVIADEKHRVRLPLEEAREVYFWDYYQGPNSPETVAWGTGLFRYLTDAQVARIVKDVQETVRDEHTRNVLGSLLQQVWGATMFHPHQARGRRCIPATFKESLLAASMALPAKALNTHDSRSGSRTTLLSLDTEM